MTFDSSHFERDRRRFVWPRDPQADAAAARGERATMAFLAAVFGKEMEDFGALTCSGGVAFRASPGPLLDRSLPAGKRSTRTSRS